MTDRPEPLKNEHPSPKTRSHEIRDIVAVFVLSITAVLTAWCGFESSKWGGEMSIAFSQASSARIQAGNFEGTARDSRQFDLTIYAEWVTATASGRERLAGYIEERFTPEFAVAFVAWEADGRKELAREEYVPPGSVEAAEWNARADGKFSEALENNQRGDNYALLTVLFALVLFLTAMAQRSSTPIAAWLLVALGALTALAGIGIGLTFPIKI